MQRIEDLNTVGALRSLMVHMGVLFLLMFPAGIVIFIIVKIFLTLIMTLFVGADSTEYLSVIWPQSDDRLSWAIQSSTTMNCTAAFIGVVVFMIRALLKMGELPSSRNELITTHMRLGFRMIALPLLTVVVCTITSGTIFFVFGAWDNFDWIYVSISFVVMLPTAIGTWIWVWRGAWIPSRQSDPAPS